MHFKNNFMMTNTSSDIHKALKELLSILPCSKCNMNLYNSRQILTCGHISCESRIENSNTTCCHCQRFIKRENIEINNLERIIEICCNIAEIFGFKKTVENIEHNLKCVSLNEKNDDCSDVPVNNFEFYSKNSKIISDNTNLNHFKKSKKRKQNINFNVKNIKKARKCSNSISNLFIPKNINKRNYHGETKLQQECKKGHKDNVKTLLTLGADPNTHCNANWTPLQECADYGFYEIAELLLKSGANVNEPGYDCKTALHEAAKNNNLNLINLLLKYNAKKDILDKYGKKAIDYCKLKEVEELLNCNVDTINNHENQQSNNNSTITKTVNINNLKDILHQNVSKKKKIKNINCEVGPENVSNDSDLENDIKIVFENVKNNNSDSTINNLKQTKDIKNIMVCNDSQEMESQSIHLSEKIMDEYCFEDITNTSYDSKCKNSLNSLISVTTESEEFIDIIN